MNKSIYFIHIAKTGGAGILSLLDSVYGKSAVCPYVEPNEIMENLNSLSNWSAFVGHHPHDMCQVMPEDVFKFTLLRDPVTRLRSTYFHVQRDENHWLHKFYRDETDRTLIGFLRHPKLRVLNSDAMTRNLGAVVPVKELSEKVIAGELKPHQASSRLNEIRRQPASNNTFVRALENMLKLDFVGTTEQHEKSLNVLSHLLQRPELAQCIHENASTREQKNQKVTLHEEEEILKLNQFDKLLYDVAVKLLEQKYEVLLNKKN